MPRVRISTTTDAALLARARALHAGSDASMIDAALAAWVRAAEDERERAILLADPYDEDEQPDLGPVDMSDLPFDEVPPEILRLAAERRSVRA